MNNKYEKHACANCGQLIECTRSLSCQCQQITIPETAQDFIAASFDGCLCLACINKIIHQLEKASS
ncbi:cysteine-rich CWC family protein [Sunxiuqinia rutila]|uniref:cysteine-rich CWC family protein n=1 Tax=Sunxiuqinia rutila TaxID=1397841 RepID=UPI003D368412